MSQIQDICIEFFQSFEKNYLKWKHPFLFNFNLVWSVFCLFLIRSLKEKKTKKTTLWMTLASLNRLNHGLSPWINKHLTFNHNHKIVFYLLKSEWNVLQKPRKCLMIEATFTLCRFLRIEFTHKVLSIPRPLDNLLQRHLRCITTAIPCMLRTLWYVSFAPYPASTDTFKIC